ncbi:hypothetical protein [Ancylobacter sp. G4_0304]|uniref:Uncharacterized protein n=1 Tax=Ancylobacter novellus TaxID=921 RepID=A0A2W5QNH0_ANCNO|nr:MAG: hypothetical protein DI549_21775 [Ancylobacter novellus]
MPLDPASKTGKRCRAAYPLLLGIHALAAVLLFLTIFPLFQQIVSQIGRAQPLDTSTAVTAIVLALVMQTCYWARYLRVPVPAPFRGAFAGHLLMFASRVSFFFGGALFAAIFFRHVPQLDVLPPVGQGLAKALGVMGLLFAAFCFSLELERLGRAIEEGPARDS